MCRLSKRERIPWQAMGHPAYMFKNGAAPPCLSESNVNGVGGVDISDLTYLVGYMFKGGAAPLDCTYQ